MPRASYHPGPGGARKRFACPPGQTKRLRRRDYASPDKLGALLPAGLLALAGTTTVEGRE